MIYRGQGDEWQVYQYSIDLGSVTSIAFSLAGVLSLRPA